MSSKYCFLISRGNEMEHPVPSSRENVQFNNKQSSMENSYNVSR